MPRQAVVDLFAASLGNDKLAVNMLVSYCGRYILGLRQLDAAN
jgi:hypothetical protein